MFWPFIEIDGRLRYCPLAEFGAANVREGLDIYGKAVVAQPLTAHLPLHNAAQAAGKIVLVERGHCDFVTKVLHAQEAGAIAVIVANSNRENPQEAFVMDAGRQRADSDGAHTRIRIPAVMVSYSEASILFEHLRGSFLDRRECGLTVKFLGAQTAAFVLEQIEVSAKRIEQQEKETEARLAREAQEREATEALRRRLVRSHDSVSVSSGASSVSPSPSVAFSRSTTSASLEDSPTDLPGALEGSRAPAHQFFSTDDSMETVSVDSEVSDNQRHHLLLPELKMNHWCPLTTGLLIVDTQNYFALPQNDKCLEPQCVLSKEFYHQVTTVMLPRIQDVLLACRTCDQGIEVVYSIVESATADGRERSRAHKQAGIHVPKGGFGAQILPRISPRENDVVIPRTSINLFESTGVDYVLRNLGVSHLVLMGISLLQTIPTCAQTALERGYQVTLIRDAIAAESPRRVDDMVRHCERLGCQITTAAAFASDIQSFVDEYGEISSTIKM
ncbi:hypothetical protein P43SY_007978 [Pythium insidiosum]|uniref:Isochorismatase-like domain-containing protein n=1 Tax=Pythium insidiosum TaxID=114742 RepID=A0AAD5Q6S7_PYTIN|nr:hypothetical protein P43SY_007978 [Pythium insidiosum]